MERDVDHSELIAKNEHRLWKKEKGQRYDKKAKGEQQKKPQRVWDVDVLFPIPSKQKALREERLNVEETQQQGSLIDKAVKKNLRLRGMRNPLYVTKRQTQSQSAIRSIKNAGRVPSKKSSLKASALAAQNNLKSHLQKSQISFNLDFAAIDGPAESTARGDLNTAAAQEPQRRHQTSASSDRGASSSSSRGSSRSATEGNPGSSTPQLTGGYKSKADQKLDETVEQMNKDPNHRLDRLLAKTSNRKVLELTGKTNA